MLRNQPDLRGDHAGQSVAGGVDVRHHVDAPGELPLGVRGRAGIVDVGIGAADAGVGAEEIDAAELLFGRADEFLDVGFLRDVRLERDAADGLRDLFGASAVEVGDDDAACAFAWKRSASALPMPLAPPVTMTTLSLTFMAALRPVSCSQVAGGRSL